MVTVLLVVAAAVFAYAAGSVSFAVIFSKAFAKKDVREFGSGNAGMTNVMRVVGVLPGLLTFICDALKGFAACGLARWVFFPEVFKITGIWWLNPVYGAYFCGILCMLGHAFPLFFGFKGGKGVATSIGIFLVCCPAAVGIGIAVFIILVLISHIVSLSSLCAILSVVITVALLPESSCLMWPQFLMTTLMAALVFMKHKDNIVRLIHGEEKRLVVRKGE